MNPKILLLLFVLAAFGGLSLVSISQVGYFGIWEAGLANWGAGQLLADLVIACLLICAWMIVDARRHERNAWPFILLTLAAGSFGPLCYLIWREWGAQRAPVASTG